MNRDEWLKARMTGIGGSDAAAVLGASKFRTPYQVWAEKRGESPPAEETEPMRWGSRLEPLVRQEYSDRTGRTVMMPDRILRHPKHDWMLATIDGVTDDGRLVEIKTARRSDGWGEPGTDEVPTAYLIQVQHYMAVTAIPVADVAVLIGGQDFRIYEVPADAELQDLIVEQEAEFWRAVKEGTPPNPVSLADMQARYGRASRAASVKADDQTLDAIAHLRRLRIEREEIEGEEEIAKAAIMAALGEADTLVDREGRALVTWKAAKAAQRFDSAAFKAAHPDLYSAFLKAGEPSRRFLLKE